MPRAMTNAPPARDCQLKRLAPNPGEIDLDSGDQEQEARPHPPEHLHRSVRANPVENLRVDQNAEQDLQHHGGDAKPDRQLADERCQTAIVAMTSNGW
jgi:hypothetical protein